MITALFYCRVVAETTVVKVSCPHDHASSSSSRCDNAIPLKKKKKGRQDQALTESIFLFCFFFVVASSILFVEHILFRRFKIFVGFLFDFLLFILFFWFCCFQIELFVAWIIRCVCQ